MSALFEGTRPHHLYRYRRLNVNTLLHLERGQVFFQSPLKYNDPFEIDLFCEFRGAAGNARDHFESFVRFEVDRVFSGAFRGGLDRSLGYILRLGTETSQAGNVEETRAALNALSDDDIDGANAIIDAFWQKRKPAYGETFGMCCFSEHDTDPLMWAHYADEHRGVCLMINTYQRPVLDWRSFRYEQVNYAIERSLDVVECGYEQAFRRMMLTKAQCWSYEKEWRLISSKGHGVRISSNRNVDAVILGLRIRENEPSLRGELYSTLSNFMVRAPDPWSRAKPQRKQLRIYQIVKDPRRYLLATVPVYDLRSALGL